MWSLFNIPRDVWLTILSEWLELKVIGKLDVVLVNARIRSQFLDWLKSMAGVQVYSPKKKLGVWLYSRGVKLEKLVLADQAFVGNHLPYDVNFQNVLCLELHTSVPYKDEEKAAKIKRLVEIIHQCTGLKVLLCNDTLIPQINETMLSQLEELSVVGSLNAMKAVHQRLIDHCRQLKSFVSYSSDYPIDVCRQLMANNPNLHRIRFPVSNMEIFDVITQNSSYLEDIGLDLTESWNISHIYQLINCCPLLRNIRVTFKSKLISLISGMSRKELTIRGYEDDDLVPFVKLFPQLSSFELTCSQFAKAGPIVEEILNHSSASLSRLSCSECDMVSTELFKAVVRCPHLTVLGINVNSVNHEDFMNSRLQSLILCCHLSLVDVMNILRNCRCLTFCCFSTIHSDAKLLNQFKEFLLSHFATQCIELYVTLTTLQTLEFKYGKITIKDELMGGLLGDY